MAKMIDLSGANLVENMGFNMVQMTQKLALRDDAPQKIKENWNTIKSWLEFEGTELGPDEQVRIENAWRAYLAVGIAPSNKLQPTFDLFSQDMKVDDEVLQLEKPPREVIHAFDQMLATNDEIKQKRAFDNYLNRKKSAFAVQKVVETKPTVEPVRKRINFSVFARIFIIFTVAWPIWVYLRHDGNFEIFGFEFETWHQGGIVWGKEFFKNLLVPPGILLIGGLAFKWVMRGRQK